MKRCICGLCVLWVLVWARFCSAQTGIYSFSTLAGMAGVTGSSDGSNAMARFSSPGGIAVDAGGNVYVSDIFSNTVRKVSMVDTNWVVTTIAGVAGVPGTTDGTNENALFDRPNGVALDRAGNLFIADHYNHTIRKLTLAGTNWVVTTIAGFAGVHGGDDGTNSQARFWSPTGIAVDKDDVLYVADTANFTVRRITPLGTNWVVTTIAGQALTFGFMDGTNTDAQFDFPYGIGVDGSGNVYVADSGNNAIRKVSLVGSDWVVTTIAGVSGNFGSDDGPGSIATFNFPNSVCSDSAGNLYVTDQSNDTVRKLVPAGNDWMVRTVAGLALHRGTSDGIGTDVRFTLPWGIAVDAAGTLYVADYGNQTIRKGVFMPFLKISFVSGKAVLSWPLEAGGFLPETSTSLDPATNWISLTNPPVTNGLNLIVTDKLGAGPAFYRLHKW